MSLEKKYYAEYTVSRETWFSKAINSLCNAANKAVEKVINGIHVLKNNPGPVAAATIAAATPNFVGCVFDTSGLPLNPDAHVQNDRPIDDGSFDGDVAVNPDGGDGSTNPDGGDGSTNPDAGDGAVIPDAEPDAQVTPEICDDGIDNDNNGLTDCNDVAACNGVASGAGAVCGPDGQEHETGCSDTADNDHDGFPDCADIDCLGYQNVADGWACDSTIPGLKVEINCADGTDNDGDGTTDCADIINCNGESCGQDCECGIDGQKHQTDCSLGADGDGDGWEGCIDGDCQNATRCEQFTHSCGAIPTGNTCDMGGGQIGYCSEYDMCVDG